MAGPCFNGIPQCLRPFSRREACLGQHGTGLAFFGRKLLDLEKGPAPEQRELNLPQRSARTEQHVAPDAVGHCPEQRIGPFHAGSYFLFQIVTRQIGQGAAAENVQHVEKIGRVVPPSVVPLSGRFHRRQQHAAGRAGPTAQHMVMRKGRICRHPALDVARHADGQCGIHMIQRLIRSARRQPYSGKMGVQPASRGASGAVGVAAQ